jgi:hypothetical protein
MQSGQAITALYSTISLALLAVLAMHCLRDLAVDWFRQDMFAVRDEIFDLAAKGELSFDDPVYGLLRTTMNGFIRFGHRVSLLTIFSASSVLRRANNQRLRERSFLNRWTRESSRLDPALRGRLATKISRMHKLVLALVFFGSPVMVTLMLPLVAIVLLRQWLRALGDRLRKFVAAASVVQRLDGIDTAALELGRETSPYTSSGDRGIPVGPGAVALPT